MDTYKKFEKFVQVVGVAGLAALVLFVASGGTTLSVFLFFSIIFFYFGANNLERILNGSHENYKKDKDRKSAFLINVLLYLALIHIATSLTTTYLVDYCNGFFEDEMQCELRKAESAIRSNYDSESYEDREYGLW